MIDELLRIAALLAQDREGDLAVLHRRDRDIALAWREHETGGDSRVRRVRRWAADRTAAGKTVVSSHDAVLEATWFAMSLIGFVLGAVAASGLLLYDGSERVNVLAALALLIGLQGLTVVATVVVMLPARLREAVPGLAGVQRGLSAFSPGRAIGAVMRFAPQSTRATLTGLQALARGNERIYARLLRWLTLLAAQVFAVGFNVGLLVAYLAAVVFTDLAFGWNTTLDADASSVHRLTSTLSAPWASWLPQAVPGIELIEASRYFRADPELAVDAAALGQWWAFVALCLVTYAAIPRLILLVVANRRVRRAFEWTIAHLPGVHELLYRLDTDPVETQALAPEVRHDSGPRPTSPATSQSTHGPSTVVVWGDLDPDAAFAAKVPERVAGFSPACVLRAGVGAVEDDEATVQAAASSPDPVVLLVKSWEPPLGELVDFLVDLRAAAGAGRPIGVITLAATPAHAPTSGDLDTWRATLSRIGDPWLSVSGLPQ